MRGLMQDSRRRTLHPHVLALFLFFVFLKPNPFIFILLAWLPIASAHRSLEKVLSSAAVSVRAFDRHHR